MVYYATKGQQERQTKKENRKEKYATNVLFVLVFWLWFLFLVFGLDTIVAQVIFGWILCLYWLTISNTNSCSCTIVVIISRIILILILLKVVTPDMTGNNVQQSNTKNIKET